MLFANKVCICYFMVKKDTLIGKGHSNYLKRPLGEKLLLS